MTEVTDREEAWLDAAIEAAAFLNVKEPSELIPALCALSAKLAVDKAALQSVFDTAVHSLDFSSGFLDDEEVRHLREVAVALGVDPMVATPRQFACKYRPGHYSLKFDRYIGSGAERQKIVVVGCRDCSYEEKPPLAYVGEKKP